MQELKKTHTLLLCIIIVILFFLFLRITGLIKIDCLSSNAAFTVEETVRAALMIGLAYFLGEGHIFSHHGTKFFSGLKVGAFIVCPWLLGLAAYFSKNYKNSAVPSIVLFALLCLMVGIAEETCFRGLVTNILAKRYIRNRKGLYLTVLISGAFFGLIHFSNTLAGDAPSGVIIQAICTFWMGCYLSAVYLRTGNLWIVVFMHALQDFLAMNLDGTVNGSKSIGEAISNYSGQQLAAILVFLIPLLFILRKSKSVEIIQRYKEMSLNSESKIADNRSLQANEE